MRRQLVQDLSVLLMMLGLGGLGFEYGKREAISQLKPVSEAQQTQISNVNQYDTKYNFLSTFALIGGSFFYYTSRDNKSDELR